MQRGEQILEESSHNELAHESVGNDPRTAAQRGEQIPKESSHSDLARASVDREATDRRRRPENQRATR